MNDEKKIKRTEENSSARNLFLQIENKEDESNITHEGEPRLSPRQEEIYREALWALRRGNLHYAVGAAFARHAYTQIWRTTKDLDISVRPKDLRAAFDLLEKVGFKTEVVENHWLAKAWKDGYFIDFIFGTGHGQIPINDEFFEGSLEAEILGVPSQLMPVEEMIAAACYIKGRRRFDAMDTAHLILVTHGQIDWARVLQRLGENQELLLMDLLFFDFIYPGHADYLPKALMIKLFEEVRQRWQEKNVDPKLFHGSLLDPFSFVVDIEDWGYHDSRNLRPLVNDQGELL
jgi:hypothetical protein